MMKGPSKKEQVIDAMSNEEVVNELKERKLLTFGTVAEKKDRLKKHHGRHQYPLLYNIAEQLLYLGITPTPVSGG